MLDESRSSEADLSAILGPAENRYFGNGLYRVGRRLSDIHIDPESATRIHAKANLTYPPDWSTKTSTELTPHISTVDAFLLGAYLCQSALTLVAGFDSRQIAGSWLRDVTLRSGQAACETLAAFPVEGTLAIDSSDNAEYEVGTFETRIGTIRFSATLSLAPPTNTAPAAEPFTTSDNVTSLYESHYWPRRTSIDRLDLAPDRLVIGARVTSEPTAAVRDGIEDAFAPALTIVEAVASLAQLSQVLLYQLDGLERSASNTLWMRRVHFTRDHPPETGLSALASCRITRTHIQPMRGHAWRIADFTGTCGDIAVTYNLAHQLPDNHQPGPDVQTRGGR